MLIVITTPHLSSSDIALLETAVLKEAGHDVSDENKNAKDVEARIVLSGDGVYAPVLNSKEFDALFAQSGTPVAAISDDVLSRGAKMHSAIQLIDNKTFAALSTHHQQWVTL